MALFKTKEEKQEAKMEKFLKKYGLENISEKDMEVLENISGDMLGLGKFGTMMTFKIEEQAKVQHLSALVEQNWVIVRMLSNINKNLERLIEKD